MPLHGICEVMLLCLKLPFTFEHYLQILRRIPDYPDKAENVDL